MIQENELAMLLIGIWVLVYAWKIKQTDIPEYRYFFAGFYCLIVSLAATVFESFFLNHLLNIIEHLCYSISSVLLAIWFFRVLVFKRQQK